MERPCPCGSGLIVKRAMQRNRGGKQSPGRWPLCSECRSDQKAYARNYRKTHREERIAYNKQYRLDNQEAVRASGRERARKTRQDNPGLVKARYQAWYRQLRNKILAHYGTVCACCGGARYLGIDHLDGNGREHREEIFGNHRFGGGPNFWLWLVENGFPDGYQVLCRSCNRSKGTGPACTLNHGRPASLAGLARFDPFFPEFAAIFSSIRRRALSTDMADLS